MFKKGIFIVGVRKCGTTSLFDVLARHPKIITPKYKEPQFFCLSHDAVKNNMQWYKSLFKNEDDYLLDGSTLYYQYPNSYKEISHYFSEAKFILCLRDPAKRFYSAYWHMKSKAQKVEKRTLDEIIQNLHDGTVQEIIENEQKDLQNASLNNLIDISYLDKNYHYKDMMAPVKTIGLNPFSFYEYYNESVYSLMFPFFSKQTNTHVVFFEKLLSSPKEELQKIHNFLEIEASDKTLRLYENINKTMTAEESRIMSAVGETPLYSFLKTKLSGNLKHKIKKILYKETPTITENEYLALRKLLDGEYNFWQKKYPELSTLWKF